MPYLTSLKNAFTIPFDKSCCFILFYSSRNSFNWFFPFFDFLSFFQCVLIWSLMSQSIKKIPVKTFCLYVMYCFWKKLTSIFSSNLSWGLCFWCVWENKLQDPYVKEVVVYEGVQEEAIPISENHLAAEWIEKPS